MSLFRVDLKRFLVCNSLADTIVNRFLAIACLSGVQAVLMYRFRCWCARKGHRVIEVLLLRIEELIFGSSILRYYGVQIGPGLYMPHPFGIVIGGATIGKNFSIGQHCSVGGRKAVGAWRVSPADWKSEDRIEIGDWVFMGAGSCVLGPVRIGDNVIIGANSVVTTDVPSNVIVVGVPASIVKELDPYED